MKKTLLFLVLFASVVSYEAMGSTCGRISLIGEFNGWSSDYWMIRNPESPDLFTVFLTVKAGDDTDTSGFIDMKFRMNGDWGTNWGGLDFPTGIGVPNSSNNIPVPPGTYLVTFNCSTAAYNFQATCGNIGMIGEFNNWNADAWMTRDAENFDLWTAILILKPSDDTDTSGFVDMKFRMNGDWGTNWGGLDFPTGIGVPNSTNNIPVPVGTYKVTFNCATGAYNFISTCGEISIIGEFNAWSGDVFMTRDMANPDNWSVVLTIPAGSDTDTSGFVDMKFRMNADWGTNWGGLDFPTGIGVPNSSNNIPVPFRATGLTTDYLVTFNCSTGAYNFTAASGAISMIGAFNDWNGDIPMNRDAVNPNLWKLSRSWFADSEVKFRENKDWTVNWGGTTFPNGTGVPQGGTNIPLLAGKYDVTFNSTTLEYSFVTNENFCGEIGMVGNFNNWGVGATGKPPTDVWMVRDPKYPSQFTASYNFTSSTNLLFRLDADLTMANSWGGTFPAGPTVPGPLTPIVVPGGKYDITFNCQSGDFKFTRLGNSVTAPQVFNMNIDGNLNESDWKINQNVSQVVSGTPTSDLNTVKFGVTYNANYLYVGVDVTDSVLTPWEMGEIFIDGNKSGGPYDEYDAHLRFGAGLSGPYIMVVYPDTIPGILLGFAIKPDGMGFTAELAVPWDSLHVNAVEGGMIGFDMIVTDVDSLNGNGAYQLAWNGGLQDYVNTSSFGDLIFGTLSCGCISMYNTTIGDVVLRNPAASVVDYVGTYQMFDPQNFVFRKDLNDAVQWGGTAFPSGTAALSGPAIPATAGRYRIAFNCLTGEYAFVNDDTAGEGIAFSDYTDTPPAIDGELSEYTLSYGSSIVVEGVDNNTVTWGSVWDQTSVYFGVHVVDAAVGGTGNPWECDAVEYYINGDHSENGTYNKLFDTQLVQDFKSNTPPVDTALWMKADGVPITNWSAKWLKTDDGYSVELRLGWSNFQFLPGKGKSIGFSLGNDDNNGGTGRAGQSVWFGTASNWNNTGDLGDLQLAGGPYYFNVADIVDYSDQIVLFPNPSKGNVYLRMVSDSFKGNVTLHVSDMAGRTVINKQYDLRSDNMITLDASLFTHGMYFVTILGENNTRAVKKLVIQ